MGGGGAMRVKGRLIWQSLDGRWVGELPLTGCAKTEGNKMGVAAANVMRTGDHRSRSGAAGTDFGFSEFSQFWLHLSMHQLFLDGFLAKDG